MSANAALLPCPICAHTVFETSEGLRDRLIFVSTNKIPCPVCQEEVAGIDKLTIHLFSHVKLIVPKVCPSNLIEISKETKHKNKVENQNVLSTLHKRSRSCGVKNKTTAATSAPVKFVKIFPKLPVISLNTVPVLDMSRPPVDESIHVDKSVYVPAVKTENSIIQSNTTCYVCGLQFVDVNILKMHRCLIHNIDENANPTYTRYQCHICPKNFKMRGSLMVHLRVAHYGFSSNSTGLEMNKTKDSDSPEGSKQVSDKIINMEINDNKQWQCDVCRKSFTTKYFLKKHKRLHTGETPYACGQCNKTFTFQQSYHKHLLYHNDEKPHVCTYCGRAFKELSTLHNHQRIHTGEKPFSCETCGKCFRQRVSYLVHRRIHTGVMPYKCTACNKSFRYKVSQRTHKCQAQPPGTVIRQTGQLVEKLKKKLPDVNTETVECVNSKPSAKYPVISEENAELVRFGAKLSLEDTENENFALIEGSFHDCPQNSITATNMEKVDVENNLQSNHGAYLDSTIDDLIDSIPGDNNNVPSPSEILKNLCLNQDDVNEEENPLNYNEFLKDLNELF